MIVRNSTISVLALATTCGWAVPAQAQDASAVAIQQELAAMREQMAAMAARMETLEAQLEAAQAQATAAETTATSAAETARAAVETAPKTQVSWRGAPELTAPGGWSFKPRGRIQLDAGYLGAPAGIDDRSTGFGTEVRRAYLGFDGKIPGGFSYRAEIDVAGSSVEVTDLYLTYQASKALALTVGQHKPFWGLEEMTSDLFTSFTERAAINTAFGYERRLGASAALTSGQVVVQGGVFTDNVGDLNNDENNSVSFDGRAVFMPTVGGSQLHFGGSVHHRKLNDAATSVRYRVRPFIHTPDIRFVDTGAIPATSETGYGLEAAWISGRFHATGESHWQTLDRVGGPNPTFFGGYAEAGVFLTKDDTRSYRGGVFERVRPKNGVDKGGIGAIELNLRYDHLDLTDAGIAGGTQNGYLAALVWTPTDYTRFMLNYGRLSYRNASYATTGGDRNYEVDAVGMRAQVDF